MDDPLTDLFTALALVLVIEGILYAVAPDGMKRMAAMAVETPTSSLRTVGLVAAVTGVAIVWLIRS